MKIIKIGYLKILMSDDVENFNQVSYLGTPSNASTLKDGKCMTLNIIHDFIQSQISRFHNIVFVIIITYHLPILYTHASKKCLMPVNIGR